MFLLLHTDSLGTLPYGSVGRNESEKSDPDDPFRRHDLLFTNYGNRFAF